MSYSLRVFVSSRMEELAPERLAVEAALEALGVDAWLFEKDAGARPTSIEHVFLEEVEEADLYVGLFWKGYGAHTIDEFEHARRLGKPCLLYEKRTDLDRQRDPKLQAFLDRISRVETGLTIGWFDTPDELGAFVKRDLALELAQAYRRHRENRRAHTLPAAATEDRRNLLILLDKVKHTWIHGVFEHATTGKVLLDIGKTMWPEAVARPWEEVLTDAEPAHQAAPTKMIDLFEASGRALLILGAPGSGKTIALLDLAHALLARAERDPTQPIPVVFNLSAWSDPDQAFADWLIAELSDKYRIPKKLGRAWLDGHRLLLLLDGLDEVRPDQRAACIDAINAFARESLHGLAVCSRLEEYDALYPKRLELDSAVCLQPLNAGQVDAFLTGAAADLDALRATLASDPALQALADTPLMLHIMSEVYQDAPAAPATAAPTTTEERRHHLIDGYVARMFERLGVAAPFSQDQTTAWLAWLAHEMNRHHRSVFLIEHLQPNWLATRGQRWTYLLGSRLLGGGLLGLIVGLLFGFFVWESSWEAGDSTVQELPVLVLAGTLVGSLVGLFSGLIRGLYLGFRHDAHALQGDIKTAETLKWSWKGARKHGLRGLLAGLLLGLLAMLAWKLTLGEETETAELWVPLFLLGTTPVLAGGAVGALFGGLRTSVVQTKMIPNEGIQLTMHHAALAGLWAGAAAWLVFGLMKVQLLGGAGGSLGTLGYGLLYGLPWGLFIGLFASLWFGGLDVIQHYVLRLLLVRSGVIARPFVRFLNYATRLIFLQKVGGAYIFIHRLLLEHFAALRPLQRHPEALPSEKPV